MVKKDNKILISNNPKYKLVLKEIYFHNPNIILQAEQIKGLFIH
jgi:hypothetical protein